MYNKSTSRSGSWIWKILLVVVVAIFVGALGTIFLLSKGGDEELSDSETLSNSVESSVQPGTVAVLATGIVNRSNTTGATPNEATDTSAELVFSLPDGWASSGLETIDNPCGGNNSWNTYTYTKDSVTLKVYENGYPTGCDRAVIADVYLDFDYSETNKLISIKSDEISFCKKTDNPACPQGDSKVSLFVGNESADSIGYEVNPLTNKTYFFSVEDTRVQSNLDSQILNFVEIITSSFSIN